MLREVASKTNDLAGDGTTTATVLAQAIVKEGAPALGTGLRQSTKSTLRSAGHLACQEDDDTHGVIEQKKMSKSEIKSVAI